MKSDLGENLKSEYFKILAFFYGNHLKMIDSIRLSIQKYNLAPKTKEVVNRLNKLKKLLDYSLKIKNDRPRKI